MVDRASLVNLIAAGLREGISGFLASAVASEVDFLSRQEREEIIRSVATAVGGRVPFIVAHQTTTPTIAGILRGWRNNRGR